MFWLFTPKPLYLFLLSWWIFRLQWLNQERVDTCSGDQWLMLPRKEIFQIPQKQGHMEWGMLQIIQHIWIIHFCMPTIAVIWITFLCSLQQYHLVLRKMAFTRKQIILLGKWCSWTFSYCHYWMFYIGVDAEDNCLVTSLRLWMVLCG